MTSIAAYSEQNETDAKRLFKAINELVKHVDQKRKHAKTCAELFTNSMENLRLRLCGYAEKLMFAAPSEYGRKCEDILWRKGFYDIYTNVKRLKKESSWSMDEISYLQQILESGIGYYYHLLIRLQEEFEIDLRGIIDFPLKVLDYGLKKTLKKEPTLSMNQFEEDKSGQVEWARNAIYKCLTYIGDLNRYMLDLFPGWDLSIAHRFYWQAICWKPNIGMAHNRLGSLANSQNNVLDAVYYYLRCLSCEKPFEAAKENLTPLLEQHSPPLNHNTPANKQLFSQFLHLVHVWYFQIPPSKDIRKLCLEFLDNMNTQYTDLNVTKLAPREPVSLQDMVFKKDDKRIEYIHPKSIFKVLVICFICHEKLLQKDPNLLDSSVIIVTGIIRKLIEQILNDIKNVLPAPVPPSSPLNGEAKKSRRRRRRRRAESSSDECSDSNVAEQLRSSDMDSEEDLIFDDVSDSETSQCGCNGTNGHISQDDDEATENGNTSGIHSRVDQINDADKLSDFLDYNCALLQTIKISCDWLECNPGMLIPIDNWAMYMDNFVSFLNYVTPICLQHHKNGMIEKTDVDDRYLEKVAPLAEDIHLRELKCIKSAHGNIDWSYEKSCHLSSTDQMKIRIERLVDFGKFLTNLDNSKVKYNSNTGWFTFLSNISPQQKDMKNGKGKDGITQRGKLMKDMGQLWLEEEVRNLESKMKKNEKSNLLPPYLVLDSDALTYHCILVKKLVQSKKFIILIPVGVVSALDELKRTSGRARDAIRWLESQFREGNRFVRAQRTNERLSIPSVTYPRRKDKEAWSFMKILECCYFLSCSSTKTNTDCKQQKDGSNFVRLLTGSRIVSNMASVKDDTIKSFSAVSSSNGQYHPALVANSAGIMVEHIVDFHNKWKKSSSNG